MLFDNERKLHALVEASKGTNHLYDIIEYRGKKLLISRGKLESAIHITWERVHDQETAVLAEELGLTPRKLRGIISTPEREM